MLLADCRVYARTAAHGEARSSLALADWVPRPMEPIRHFLRVSLWKSSKVWMREGGRHESVPSQSIILGTRTVDGEGLAGGESPAELPRLPLLGGVPGRPLLL